MGRRVRWTPEIVTRLGTVPDSEIAEELGISRERVRQIRTLHGIASHQESQNVLPEEAVSRLGTDTDIAVAEELAITPDRVRKHRHLRDIPSHRETRLVVCGTRYSYDRGCRCDVCKRAHADGMKEWVKNNPEKARANRDRQRDKVLAAAPHEIGKIGWYGLGCRCDECRKTASDYYRNRAALEPPEVDR